MCCFEAIGESSPFNYHAEQVWKKSTESESNRFYRAWSARYDCRLIRVRCLHANTWRIKNNAYHTTLISKDHKESKQQSSFCFARRSREASLIYFFKTVSKPKANVVFAFNLSHKHSLPAFACLLHLTMKTKGRTNKISTKAVSKKSPFAKKKPTAKNKSGGSSKIERLIKKKEKRIEHLKGYEAILNKKYEKSRLAKALRSTIEEEEHNVKKFGEVKSVPIDTTWMQDLKLPAKTALGLLPSADNSMKRKATSSPFRSTGDSLRVKKKAKLNIQSKVLPSAQTLQSTAEEKEENSKESVDVKFVPSNPAWTQGFKLSDKTLNPSTDDYVMKHKYSCPAERIAQSLTVSKHAKKSATPLSKAPESNAPIRKESSPLSATETTTEAGRVMIIDGIVCEIVD